MISGVYGVDFLTENFRASVLRCGTLWKCATPPGHASYNYPFSTLPPQQLLNSFRLFPTINVKKNQIKCLPVNEFKDIIGSTFRPRKFSGSFSTDGRNCPQ